MMDVASHRAAAWRPLGGGTMTEAVAPAGPRVRVFDGFRRAAETPFNRIFEARP